MDRLSPWEEAKKVAEGRCPYRSMPEIPPGEKWDSSVHGDFSDRYDEEDDRDDWIPGFAFGGTGVPDRMIRDQDDRCFWQGYDAGVAWRMNRTEVSVELEPPKED